MEYILLSVLWILWCALHSGLISLTFTKYTQRVLGGNYKYYRLVYNLFSAVTLILVVAFSGNIQHHVIFIWEGKFVLLQLFFIVLSLSLFWAGYRHYDGMQFLGIRQIMTGSSYGSLSDSNQIDTSGILGITRHPWYLAALILIWVNFRTLYLSTFLTISILTAYLVIGTFLEERKLIREYGDEYRNYQKNVSMLFPFKWIGSFFVHKKRAGE